LQLRQAFEDTGVLGAMMSGSGPTVFALCESYDQAQQLQEQVRVAIPNPDLELMVTQLSNTGIRVASD